MTKTFHYKSGQTLHYNINLREYLKQINADNIPGEETPVLKQIVDLGCGAVVIAYAYGEHIFISNANTRYNRGYHQYVWSTYSMQEIESEPFLQAKVVGKAYLKHGDKERYKKVGWDQIKYIEHGVLDYIIGYNDGPAFGYRSTPIYEPLRFLKVVFTTNRGEEFEEEIGFMRPRYGNIDLAKSDHIQFHVDLDFHGLHISWQENVQYSRDFFYTLKAFSVDKHKAWELWLTNQNINADKKGIASIEKKKTILPNLKRLEEESFYLYQFYQWLCCGQVKKGITNNQLLSVWLKANGEDYDKMVSSLKDVLDKIDDFDHEPTTKSICLLFDEAAEKDRKNREHKEWYLRKTNTEKASGLGCDPEIFPRTHAAICDGRLPLNVFHDPNDKLKAVNTEWGLWEKAFKREGWEDILCNIASNASRRSTYEKDITPYIAFMFRLEKYLDRHAPRPKNGKKRVGWKAMPKYIESQWELEMETANENGTVKRRSALTPVPDNESGVIEVPYAAIAIHGRQTTYCYSQYYILFEEGELDYETKTPVVNELEEKLNGRDDYGLMYYTLTGSPTNRGYPTFLTIFERRKDYTHVHFHRVHPNKYKDGRPVPAHKLVEECYRYMAGNIRAEEIHSQQGDLIFIRCEEPKTWSEAEMKGIKDFESHNFVVSEGESPVLLMENTSKTIKNRLGHILAKSRFVVAHHEHEDLTDMPSGWYEVRRCKSWEANPVAIWSYTID